VVVSFILKCAGEEEAWKNPLPEALVSGRLKKFWMRPGYDHAIRAFIFLFPYRNFQQISGN